MTPKIAIIDCSPLAGPYEKVSEENYKKVAEEIGEAMTNLGICYLINHGVDKKKIDDVYKSSKEFFELPAEIKAKYRKRFPKKIFHGYSGSGDEFLNEEEGAPVELREMFDVSKVCWKDEATYPNEEVPGLKIAFDDISNDLADISKKLLRCLEVYFGFEENFLISRHKNLDDDSVKSQTITRTAYYCVLNPDDDIPENAIRCGEHKDWGSITILFQDMVGGLEVETLDGEWIEAVPIENSILLNSGELVEIYTSGKLLAAKHRVRIISDGKHNMMTNPRQSFIHFVHPDGAENATPSLPIGPGKENFINMEPVNANEFFLKHMEAVGTY